jgi:7-cyano-7-deazaguanine reductase
MLQNTCEFFSRIRPVTDAKLPLGQKTAYPDRYEPGLLFPIAREDSRAGLCGGELPFSGVDIWNAWELTWLGKGDLPFVATAEIRIPASSPKLIESKSLKLYLNSLSMSRFASAASVAETIAADLTACLGATVEARVERITDIETTQVSTFSGTCLDTLAVGCDQWEVQPTLLKSNPDTIVSEELYTHLLRSLCPVTSQPDMGSIAIHYHGPQIDPASLLQYVVSYREHNDFHEACVERIFVDILQRCQPEKLSVFARYQRRGGIDINPFRSNFEDAPPNLRLWRQ